MVSATNIRIFENTSSRRLNNNSTNLTPLLSESSINKSRLQLSNTQRIEVKHCNTCQRTDHATKSNILCPANKNYQIPNIEETVKACSTCKRTDHKTKANSLCPSNPKYREPSVSETNQSVEHTIKACSTCQRTDHKTKANSLCPYNREPSVVVVTCVCGSSTHKRRNHRDCTLNPRNQATVEVK